MTARPDIDPALAARLTAAGLFDEWVALLNRADGRPAVIVAECRDCPPGTPVDTSRPGVMREVRGWERVRSQGGANAIVDRRETGRYLCVDHGAMMRAGLDPDQGSLFG